MTHTRSDGNTSAKDEARTPPEIFRKLDAEFHFDFDAACTRENCLCKNGIFGNEISALSFPWAWNGTKPWTYFCNPPYSHGNILAFVHKAYLESGKGATVVLLIPSDPSTQYFSFCFENAHEIRFMQPRVRFNNPDGTPMKGSPQTGSMIVVFRPGETPAVPKIGIWKWKE